VSGSVLRNHAEAEREDVYHKAVERVAAETGLPAETLSVACPYTIDQLLTDDLLAE